MQANVLVLLVVCVVVTHGQFLSHLHRLWDTESLFNPIGFNFTFSQCRTEMPPSDEARSATLPRERFKSTILSLIEQMRHIQPQDPQPFQKERVQHLTSIYTRWNQSTELTIPKYYHALDLQDKYGLLEALKNQQVKVMRGAGGFDGAWISTIIENGVYQYGTLGLVFGGSQVETLKMNTQFCRHCCPGSTNGQRTWYGIMEPINFGLKETKIPLLGIFAIDQDAAKKAINTTVTDPKLQEKYISMIRSWPETLLERHIVTLARIASFDRANVLLEGALILREKYKKDEQHLVAKSTSKQDLDECLKTLKNGEVLYFRTQDQAFWNYRFNEAYLIVEIADKVYVNYVDVVTRKVVRSELVTEKQQGAVWLGDLATAPGETIQLGVAIDTAKVENMMQQLSNGQVYPI
jgi:hypothetical protein